MIRFNGIDRLLYSPDTFPHPGNFRWGLVTNNAAITATGILNRKELLKNGWNITRLFSPEHGLSAQAADGEKQGDTTDPLTTLPVTSLYGDRFAPSPEELSRTDGILFDIPDTGCRFYTFLWTLTHVMEACEKAGKPLVVLDRSNPTGLSPELSEGPFLDEVHCSSFIGRWSIPVRHSCSLGELALYFQASRLQRLDLTVIPCENPPTWPLTDPLLCNWIPPSPGIPEPLTALLYPGMGLLEGININEGRGTTLPFRIFGAPFIRSAELAENINALGLPGLKAIPFSYQPAWGEWANQWCQGIQWLVTNARQLRPVSAMLRVIQLLQQHYPAKLSHRRYVTNANPSGEGHLDRLLGQPDSWKKIENGSLLPQTNLQEEWSAIISPHRLYNVPQ